MVRRISYKRGLSSLVAILIMLTCSAVCCDIWGQCGNTAEFCTVSDSETKAPGTAAPGQNGCISNCGTDIVSSDAPSSRFTVGYFEGFNEQRPCLNMDASEIPLDAYTHLHFGFASLTDNFIVTMDNTTTDQWAEFANLTPSKGTKLIVSFGGWAFSTDASTYDVLRTGVSEANRVTLAKNIAEFVANTGMDGVDFDWEYPGAPDIPGDHHSSTQFEKLLLTPSHRHSCWKSKRWAELPSFPEGASQCASQRQVHFHRSTSLLLVSESLPDRRNITGRGLHRVSPLTTQKSSRSLTHGAGT